MALLKKSYWEKNVAVIELLKLLGLFIEASSSSFSFSSSSSPSILPIGDILTL